MYCCYLCYREFETAKALAKHCDKGGHLDMIKQDGGGNELWRYFPPPPDLTPDEFTTCSKYVPYTIVPLYHCTMYHVPLYHCSSRRLAKCTGRLRCCKAHSQEEMEEWILRHTHRNKQFNKTTRPSDVVSMETDSPETQLTLNEVQICISPLPQLPYVGVQGVKDGVLLSAAN